MSPELEEVVLSTYSLDPQQLAPQRRERLLHLTLRRFVRALHHRRIIRRGQRLAVQLAVRR